MQIEIKDIETKIALMEDLINRYQQLEAFKDRPCVESNKQVLELYIRKNELKLDKLLQNQGDSYD